MKTPPKDNWPTFLCSYRYKGQDWGFDLVAQDFDDAKAKLSAIHFNGKVEDKLMATIPAAPLAGLFVRAIAFLRNYLF